MIERFVLTFKMLVNNTNISNITSDEEAGSWGPEYEKQVDSILFLNTFNVMNCIFMF